MSFDWLIGDQRYSLPLSYLRYREGKYKPSEVRPKIVVPGARKWYAPWSKFPATIHYGMSEAMAFRAQDAVLSTLDDRSTGMEVRGE